MTLARAWRRQLLGASSAALIVPSAMLAAVVVLALGGGFRQVGVLGQIFAGPPAPGASGGAVAGPGSVARLLTVIPVAAVGSTRGGAGAAGGGRASGGRRGVVPAPSRGTSQTGGALVPVGSTTPIVSGRPQPPPARPAPVGSTPFSPAPHPGPSPSPKPTVVDRIVNAVTPITQQAPAPVGPAVTQAVESAGSATDSVLTKLP